MWDKIAQSQITYTPSYKLPLLVKKTHKRRNVFYGLAVRATSVTPIGTRDRILVTALKELHSLS